MTNNQSLGIIFTIKEEYLFASVFLLQNPFDLHQISQESVATEGDFSDLQTEVLQVTRREAVRLSYRYVYLRVNSQWTDLSGTR